LALDLTPVHPAHPVHPRNLRDHLLAAPAGDIISDVTELSVSVEDREAGSPIVVRLAGEADVSTRALADVLAAETAKQPRLLLIDVSALTFIDSAALHEFVRAHRKLRAGGGRLALVGPAGAVARVIQLSALDQVFPVYASVEEAVA
jgi:anti-sigma B factor antagonist